MEFPGYGCCYLTEHNADLPRVFEVGKEVLTFRSMREGGGLVKGNAARTGTSAGRRKSRSPAVLERHNWGVRLGEIAARL